MRRAYLPVNVEHERPLEMLLYQLACEPSVAGRADAIQGLQAIIAASDAETKAQIESALRRRAVEDESRLIRKTAHAYVLKWY